MIRHMFATAVTLALALAIAVGSYLLLLLSALFFGGDMGGPLAFPMMVIGVFVFGVLGCLGVLMPSVLLAERWTRRRVKELPLALFLALPICGLAGWLLGGGISAGIMLWPFSIVPLIGYWVCVRSMGVMTSAAASVLGWLLWKWALRRLPTLSAARS